MCCLLLCEELRLAAVEVLADLRQLSTNLDAPLRAKANAAAASAITSLQCFVVDQAHAMRKTHSVLAFAVPRMQASCLHAVLTKRQIDKVPAQHTK